MGQSGLHSLSQSMPSIASSACRLPAHVAHNTPKLPLQHAAPAIRRWPSTPTWSRHTPDSLLPDQAGPSLSHPVTCAWTRGSASTAQKMFMSAGLSTGQLALERGRQPYLVVTRFPRPGGATHAARRRTRTTPPSSSARSRSTGRSAARPTPPGRRNRITKANWPGSTRCASTDKVLDLERRPAGCLRHGGARSDCWGRRERTRRETGRCRGGT